MPDENGKPYPWEADGGGDTSTGTWSKPFEQPEGSGRYYIYNSTSGETKPYEQGPYAPLEQDLRDLGLLPLTSDPNYYISNPDVSPNATRFVDQYGNIVNEQNQPVTEAERKRLVGQFGDGDGGDNGAASRAERGLQEQIRQNRIAEAMSAIDLQTMRQKASLAGAQFAAPTDTGGYFPQMGPNSPLVRSGLADPMQFTGVPYSSAVGGDQSAQDLAMIRRLAGVGG
jgi:hypothetical protein